MDTNMVTITRQEYDDLIDTRDHARIMRDIAAGDMETFTAAEVEAFLDAPTPLSFWRKHRGMTQKVFAAALKISQSYLAQIETGKRVGDVNLHARMAKLLKVKIEDLVISET